MPYRDLREFLSRLKEDGDIAYIDKEVDTKFEISSYNLAAWRRGGHKSEPALFFQRVKGYNIPVVTSVFGTYRRYALAFDLTEENLLQGLLQRYERLVEPKKVPRYEAPCKQNIITGDDVDLTKLPVIWWNEGDAGPFFTATNVITKDIKTGKHNVGRYRAQLKGKDRTGLFVAEFQHIGRHYKLASEAGERTMEVAIAFGCDPVIETSAPSSIPYEWDEYAWAGGNKEPAQPVEVVAGETVDLNVPANAEFVIEGKIDLEELELEGPFGEFTLYYSGQYEFPVIHVTAITHRDNPIMTGVHMGPGENHLSNYTDNVIIFSDLKGLVPEVTGFRYLFPAFTAIVQVAKNKKYWGLARRVADIIWANKRGSNYKTIIVVDDDVDIYNPAEIFWALSVRMQPDEDVVVASNCPITGLDPSARGKMVRSIKKGGVSKAGSRLLIDATESLDLSPDIKVIQPPPGFDKVMALYDETVHTKATKQTVQKAPGR